jgi:hypothetical protein
MPTVLRIGGLRVDDHPPAMFTSSDPDGWW